MQRLSNGQPIEMTEREIAEFEASRIVPFNEQVFRQNLSIAFDAKFETYWRGKGYSDLNDLNNHSVDTKSIHHQEALSLIRWSNSSWETIVVSEESVIEDIIQNLPPFNL